MKRNVTLKILSVQNWERDDVMFAATASHEGDHATRVVLVEEEEKKTQSNQWNEEVLGHKAVTCTVEINDPDDCNIKLTELLDVETLIRDHEQQLQDGAAACLCDSICRFDILKPTEVEFEVLTIDRCEVSRLRKENKARTVCLYCMNILMRHLNDEDALLPWLADGIPDDCSVKEPDDTLLKDIEDLDVSKTDFEHMLALFTRILTREVYPEVQFGNKRENGALY